MSRGTLLALVAGSLVVLAAGSAWLVRRRAPREAEPAQAVVVATPTAGAGSSSADPTWCGKPLGAGAVGQLKDRSLCSKISLTGTAPTCLFWADCGELHFEIDCSEKAGPGQCRCDGEDGRTVPYSPAFCALDRTQPGAGLRTVLDAAATACRWAPR